MNTDGEKRRPCGCSLSRDEPKARAEGEEFLSYHGQAVSYAGLTAMVRWEMDLAKLQKKMPSPEELRASASQHPQLHEVHLDQIHRPVIMCMVPQISDCQFAEGIGCCGRHCRSTLSPDRQ